VNPFEESARRYCKLKLEHIKLRKTCKVLLKECPEFVGGGSACYVSMGPEEWCEACKQSFRLTIRRRLLGRNLIGAANGMYKTYQTLIQEEEDYVEE
jgi:hypothetical protein